MFYVRIIYLGYTYLGSRGMSPYISCLSGIICIFLNKEMLISKERFKRLPVTFQFYPYSPRLQYYSGLHMEFRI